MARKQNKTHHLIRINTRIGHFIPLLFRAIFRKQFHETGQLLVPATDSMLSRVLIHVYNRVIVTSYCRVEFVVVGGDEERETKQPYK